MKKVLPLVILLSFLLSGCYLIPVSTLTPEVPATETTAPRVTATTLLTVTASDTSTPLATSTHAATHTPVKTLTPIQVLTATGTFTPTNTRTSTKTQTPTRTFTPTKTLTPTQTSTPMPYTLQVEAPVYIKNFVHTDEGCNWMGVAGQVFDADGEPVLNLVLVASGRLNGSNLNLTAVTGIPEADVYGPGGYEIQLADEALATSGSLTIQVFDLEGNALSEAFNFNTYADCSKNLVVINFKAQ